MIINLVVVSKSNKEWLVALLVWIGVIVCHGIWSPNGVAKRTATSWTTFHERPATPVAHDTKEREVREILDFTSPHHHPAVATVPVLWTT